ncbi:hypothetical protein BHE74_00024700 [Ensete ventricosum]|nr:hypothetical protein BHE74_00024700 [Ensete ventricosum]
MTARRCSDRGVVKNGCGCGHYKGGRLWLRGRWQRLSSSDEEEEIKAAANNVVVCGNATAEEVAEGSTVGCGKGARGWERWAAARMAAAYVGKTAARSVVGNDGAAESDEGCGKGER